MKFSTADKADMLAAVGDAADVWGSPLTLAFDEAGEIAFEDSPGLITTGPVGLVSDDDLEALKIVSGEDGTLIRINGIRYRTLQILPDGDGFSTLSLEKTDI